MARRGCVVARQHNIAGLLYHRLKPIGITLPADLAEELKQEHRRYPSAT